MKYLWSVEDLSETSLELLARDLEKRLQEYENQGWEIFSIVYVANLNILLTTRRPKNEFEIGQTAGTTIEIERY